MALPTFTTGGSELVLWRDRNLQKRKSKVDGSCAIKALPASRKNPEQKENYKTLQPQVLSFVSIDFTLLLRNMLISKPCEPDQNCHEVWTSPTLVSNLMNADVRSERGARPLFCNMLV